MKDGAPDMTGRGEEPTATQTTALRAAAKRLLKPLVRLLIARDMPFTALRDLLKEVYVEVAEESFGLEGRPPTDSRVSMLTGVHRKDVRSLRAGDRAAVEPSGSASLCATVLGRWLGEPRFQTDDKTPRALPISQTDGDPSFPSLVESVSKDVRPRTVLEEFERLGLIAVEPADASGPERARLIGEALVPSPASIEALSFFGRNIGDHVAAAAANLVDDRAEGPYLERAVYYANLSPEAAAEIERSAKETGLEALRAINAEALARRDAEADAPAASARERFRFGVFFYRERENGEAAGARDPNAKGNGA